LLDHLQQSATLWLKAKTGLTAGVVAFLAFALLAALMVFIFLCVATYAWLSAELGPIFGGLATAGIFLVVALIGLVMAALARRRTQQQAALERAARTRGSALLDPRMLNLAMGTARTLGWQRAIPIALVGFLAPQWAQEARRQDRSDQAI
jgi:hypothetical protein